MGHTSQIVSDNKLLHDTSYPQRAEKYSGIEISYPLDKDLNLSGNVDFYDAHVKIIYEIKRRDKVEDAHQWQVKFYR